MLIPAVTLFLCVAPLFAQPTVPGFDPAAAVAEPAEAVEPDGETDAAEDDEQAHALMAVFDPEELGELGRNTLLDWMVLLGLIFVGLLLGRIAQILLRRAGDRLDRRGWPARAAVFADAAAPAKLLIFTIALSIGLGWLQMGEGVEHIVTGMLQLLIYISIFWYLFNLVAIVELLLRRMTERTPGTLDDQLVPIIRKTLRLFLLVVALLFIAQNVFDQNVGAWLAGFGLAGLAVSLAAQDSLKNLFGSITILLDKPFHIGDRINYGAYDGTVEEIGFRSTKVRTLTGHLVTVPNANIVNDPVENIASRPTIRRLINVTITYDTPPERIRHAVQTLRDILDEPGIRESIHPVVNGEELPPRVHFNDFNAASLNLLVIYWFAPPVWWDYLEHAERVNMRIFEAFEEAGIDFAFPTQTLHLANDAKRQLALRLLDHETR